MPLLFLGNKHLDNGPFLDVHFLKGSENAILVFGDCHEPILALHALSLACQS